MCAVSMLIARLRGTGQSASACPDLLAILTKSVKNLDVRVTMNALSLKLAYKENAKIHAFMSAVVQMPNVWFKATRPLAFARQTTEETLMTLVDGQNVSLIQTAQPHLHAGMKSVWTHVNVQGMPIVRPGITGVSAPVNLDTQEIPMVLPVQKFPR